MLLIHPPLTKPCEAPAALAYLQGALGHHDISSTSCDMNIEGLYFLLEKTVKATDTWSRRAIKNVQHNCNSLKSRETYTNPDRYKRAVKDLNRVLDIVGQEHNLKLSLSNYQHSELSPLKSSDLLTAADEYRENIYFPYFSNRFDKLLSVSSSPFVGLSINYISQALCSFAIIGFLKNNFPHAQIIVGGGLITTWLSHPQWQNNFGDIIDHYIAGPGEEKLVQLLGKTSHKKYYCPDYSTLLHNEYISPGLILPYAASTGCFWKKCSFCPEKAENNVYRQVPAKISCNQLGQLSTATQPTLIHFLDNAISPATLQQLTATSPSLPWYGFARFDAQLASKEFCIQLRKSGCVMLKLGLESGSQPVLNKMKKGIDLKIAEHVLVNLSEAGIKTYVYLLFGTPEEAQEDAERTLQFVARLHRNISFLNLAIFNLPVGSEDHKALQLSQFSDDDLTIYSDFKHPMGWDRKSIRNFLQNRFKRWDTIAEILHRDPPYFTSNHAPFFNL